jgi:hypothetical protein
MEISLLLGILVGAVLGLTGAGGGILAVPALVAGMGWSMQQAAPVALIAVASGAALGALAAHRRRQVRYRAATLMVVSGVIFTSPGLYAAHVLPQRWLLTLFALVMLIVAVRLFVQACNTSHEVQATGNSPVCINPIDERFQWRSPATWILFVSLGSLTGFMTGLLGVGGGFIVVPVMRRFTNASMHVIVGTSLMVIALIACGGVISALAHGAQLPMPATAMFALATVIGMLLGRKLAGHISNRQVQRGFSLTLWVVALSLLVKAAHIA